MEIAHVLELRQVVEFLPGKGFGIFHKTADRESPLAQRNFGLNAEIEDGKASREMLARRKPVMRAHARPGFARHFAREVFFSLDDARGAHKRSIRRFRRLSQIFGCTTKGREYNRTSAKGLGQDRHRYS